jgi:hypothetical protein
MVLAIYRNERLNQLNASCILNKLDASEKKKETQIDYGIGSVSADPLSHRVSSVTILNLWDKILLNEAIKASIPEIKEFILCTDPLLHLEDSFEQYFAKGTTFLTDFGFTSLI